ncbi:hypothetical protein OIU77_021052 [Salix suchowensis]|uniref:Uncharacterized protein n=1 Tax=Salix suchowensis TaxID=1278906 RepID=A0ABQ9C9C0_9ROSI|nr:hypothetical protein OIU77_021052 [Salix suchowensis]
MTEIPPQITNELHKYSRNNSSSLQHLVKRKRLPSTSVVVAASLGLDDEEQDLGTNWIWELISTKSSSNGCWGEDREDQGCRD